MNNFVFFALDICKKNLPNICNYEENSLNWQIREKSCLNGVIFKVKSRGV